MAGTLYSYAHVYLSLSQVPLTIVGCGLHHSNTKLVGSYIHYLYSAIMYSRIQCHACGEMALLWAVNSTQHRCPWHIIAPTNCPIKRVFTRTFTPHGVHSVGQQRPQCMQLQAKWINARHLSPWPYSASTLFDGIWVWNVEPRLSSLCSV